MAPGKLEASGFFALRTPLLPFDELEAWSAGVGGSLEDDRALLRRRLAEVIDRPEVREALFVASPSLVDSLAEWRARPDGEHGQKVERTLTRYFMRMASRATPFGLFAGCSVGEVAAETALALGPLAGYQRHTRLDMDYVCSLTEALARDPALRRELVYRPNSSLYGAAGKLRYAESRLVDRVRHYHLVAVDRTDYLVAILERARTGATLAELAAALVAQAQVDPAEAESFLGELVDGQILVAELEPAVTGPEPIHGLIATLPTGPTAAALERTRDSLDALDANGLGAPASRYREIADGLAGLPAKVELPRLFQVDLVKPGTPTLGRAVVAELRRAVGLLARFGDGGEPPSLRRFREQFERRYETRTVPLVEVLDEESGIGFERSDGPSAEASPLLAGLAFPGASPEATAPWGKREAHLLARLGEDELVLDDDDLAILETRKPGPLPDALAVMATLIGGGGDDWRVLVESAGGPSGATLLGRFCHADPALHQRVIEHLRAEEAHRPDAVYAELTHLPQGRIGNVLARPVLREHEIVYLGRSGAPLARQLPVTDLQVSVVGGRVVLGSARLGREVLPRLTNAHNFEAPGNLSLYRFLATLAHEHGTGLAWSWGALAALPFLPRVRHGRTVLALARWRLDARRLATLREAPFAAVQRLRAALRLPRWIAVADGDNQLAVDLDNVLAVETFAALVRGRDSAVVEELPVAGLCASGPEGRFTHELVVPFVLQAQRGDPRPAAARPSAAQVTGRRFAPGEEWLYAKLYTGAATADQILREVVAPLTPRTSRPWFFLRFGDPDWHVRVRFQDAHELFPALTARAAPLLADGLVWRVQLDTYEREVERYGGPAGVALAERLFCADSVAALAIVETLDGDAGADARWRLTLAGMHLLLDDLGLDLTARRELLTRLRRGFAEEHSAGAPLERQLSERYRRERPALERLLDGGDPDLAPGFEALRARSRALAPITHGLRRLDQPLPDLAGSFLHMHANRMLRSAHRAQELVLYDFLMRLYDSRAARARKK